MKIKLEFDLTPQEFRESLGLPDITGLQKKAIGALQSRFVADVKDVDVPGLVEKWLSQGITTSRQIQGLFGAALAGVMDNEPQRPEKRPDED